MYNFILIEVTFMLELQTEFKRVKKKSLQTMLVSFFFLLFLKALQFFDTF